MDIEYSFNINDVKLNSGLNADIMEVLSSPSATAFDVIQPFVADYEINHR